MRGGVLRIRRATDARQMISDGQDDDLGPRVRAVVIDGNADDDTKEKTGAIAKQENNSEIESEYLATFGDAGGDGTATMDSMDEAGNSEEEGIIPDNVNENYVKMLMVVDGTLLTLRKDSRDASTADDGTLPPG